MEFVLMFMCWAFGGFVLGWCIQAGCMDKLQKRLEQEHNILQLEHAKLVDHVLWLTHDESLGGELDTTRIPARLPGRELILPGGHVIPETTAMVVPERDPVDALLDMLEIAEVTGIKSELHADDEVNEIAEGKRPLVTLEFGDVSVRELSVWTGENSSWIPDICWKGHLLPKPSQEQRNRLHRIFRNRMAKEAAKSLKKPAGVEGIVRERDM